MAVSIEDYSRVFEIPDPVASLPEFTSEFTLWLGCLRTV